LSTKLEISADQWDTWLGKDFPLLVHTVMVYIAALKAVQPRSRHYRLEDDTVMGKAVIPR